MLHRHANPYLDYTAQYITGLFRVIPVVYYTDMSVNKNTNTCVRTYVHMSVNTYINMSVSTCRNTSVNANINTNACSLIFFGF